MNNTIKSPKNLLRCDFLIYYSGILIVAAIILLFTESEPISPLTSEPSYAYKEVKEYTPQLEITELWYNERIFLPIDKSGNLKKKPLFNTIGYGKLLNLICDYTFNNRQLRDTFEWEISPLDIGILGKPGEAWFIFPHLYRTHIKTNINTNFFIIEIESRDSIPAMEIIPIWKKR